MAGIIFRYFLTLLVFLLTAPGFGFSGPVPVQAAEKTGTIFDPVLSEISGIFASRKNSNVLWVLNDGGNAPALYAVSPGGRLLGEYPVEGIKNVDWEDMSGFRQGGEDLLLIGDVGDNKARRKSCTLYGVREPEVGGASTGRSLPVCWHMHFQYAGGPRDCEAMTVDEGEQRILLLSKRDRVPILYELPLSPTPRDILYTAKPVGRVRTIPKPTPADLKQRYGKYRSQPTSMDLSSNGRTLVILTYKHGYIFRREPGMTWDKVFASAPVQLDLPLPDTGELVQREALCIDHGKGRIIITTEQLPAPIYTIVDAGLTLE